MGASEVVLGTELCCGGAACLGRVVLASLGDLQPLLPSLVAHTGRVGALLTSLDFCPP